MDTYFSKLAGGFSKLHQNAVKNKSTGATECELVVGFVGSIRAEKINCKELNYLVSFYGPEKYKLCKVEVLDSYEGESIFPASNYNSFLKIAYEKLPRNLSEEVYYPIRMHNRNFNWDSTAKKERSEDNCEKEREL